jgi:hypothetical protein
MAITKVSVSFEVLSQITCEGDVFDHLLEVRRLDTQEEGTLLCSHYCRWPSELLPQATWIEGCFTPSEHKDDPRLVLGNHPGDITKWEHKQEDGKLFLEVYFERWERDTPVTVNLHYPLPIDYSVDTFFPRRRVLDRLWRNAERHANSLRGAFEAYYRDVENLVADGRLHPAVACTYLPKGMESYERNTECFFALEEYWGEDSPGLFYYYNSLNVSENNLPKGYLCAIPLWRKPRVEGEIVGYCPPTCFPYAQSHTR